jgi:hypothetical protein
MIQQSKWVSLFDLTGNFQTAIDPSVLATAIERDEVQYVDAFGRRVMANDGGIEDQNSKKYALSLLRTYIISDDDHPIFHEHSFLNKFGWPLDVLPDFSNINPHYIAINPKSAKGSTQEELAADWKNNAWNIGKDELKKYPNFSVEQISKEVLKEMIKRDAAGEKGMSGRGGKIPAADTIKRHALKGIKTKGTRAMP